MTPKTLKIVGTVYLVKCVLFVVAWAVIPDLPHRAAEKVRTAWAWVSR